MKKTERIVTLLLIVCSMLLLPLKVHANDGEYVSTSGGSGTSSSPYILSFDKEYASYPGASNMLAVKASSSGSGSNVWYQFTAPVSGIVTTQNAVFTTFKATTDYSSATNTKLEAVEKGKTYLFSLSSYYIGKDVNLCYHMHYATDTQAKAVYTQYNETSCELTRSCECKGQSGVPDSYSPKDVVTHPNHVWGETGVKAATCTEKGYSYKECQNCHFVYKFNDTNATGHSYTGTVTQYNSSQHKVQCKNCTEYILKDHTWTYGADISKKTCSACKLVASTGVSVQKASVQVTKLTNNQVSLTVTKPSGAYAVEVYMGTKRIKTLTQSATFSYSQSAAAKKSYRVRSVYKAGSVMKYSAYSTYAKAKANVWTDSSAGKYNTKKMSGYMYATHKTQKLYFSGKTLKCTAYIYNVRIFKLKRIKIHYTLKVGKKVYKKTITKKVNLPAYGKKKITYTLGTGISNVRTGITYKSVSVDGDWGYGWQ